MNNTDQLMAWEAQGASDYKRARAAGLSVEQSLAAATVRFSNGCIYMVNPYNLPISAERIRTMARDNTDLVDAESLARTAGAFTVMDETGDQVEW